MQAALGLQQMAMSEYHEAALSFLSCDANLGESYNEILTSNDVAVYGGLCALSSMSRSELQTKVLENANFRNFLELEPHIRRAINHFCASKYSQCLDILESYRADYLLDIYLQPLIPNMYRKIRTKSIIQYFEPFSNVKLEAMEQIFGPPLGEPVGSPAARKSFLDEIIALIEDDKLDARIDMEHGTLVAVEHDARAEAQQEALDMVDRFTREAHMKLLRVQAINAALEVKQPPRKKGDAEHEYASFDDGGSFNSQSGSANTGGREMTAGGSGISQRRGG
jgi:COP9 signalosome complex subunit 1